MVYDKYSKNKLKGYPNISMPPKLEKCWSIEMFG